MNAFLMVAIILWWIALAVTLILICVVGLLEVLANYSCHESEAAYNRGRVWAENARPWDILKETEKTNAALINENNQLRKKLFPGKC